MMMRSSSSGERQELVGMARQSDRFLVRESKTFLGGFLKRGP